MRFALIYPELEPQSICNTLKVQERHKGVFPPLHLATVAAVLIKQGHDVLLIDGVADLLSEKEIIDRVSRFEPDFLCFTATTFMLAQTLHWISVIKRSVPKPVIVGGVQMSIYPEETLSHECIDYGIMDEAEVTLPNFITAYEKGLDLSCVKGICFKQNGKIITTEREMGLKNLDEVPFPARHLLPNEKYYSIVGQRRNFTAAITSKGCPFNCVFCCQRTKGYALRSATNVVDEFEECLNKYQIREFDIFDSVFTVSRERTLEICNEIIRRRLDIIWSIRTRADLVDPEMIDLLAKANCVRIMYGIESVDANILERLKKNSDVPYMRKMIQLTQAHGIDVFGFFICGSPGETKQTLDQNVKFAIDTKLDHVQFSRMTLLPNSELYRDYLDGGYKDLWREYSKNPKIDVNLPLMGTDLPVAFIDKYIRYAYLRFYFRFSFIWRHFRKVGFANFFNKAKAALAMLFSLEN